MDVTAGMLIKAGLTTRRAFRKWRVKRRAKKRAKQIASGEIQDDPNFKDPLTEEVHEVFPQGTQTKSGIILAMVGMIVTILLNLLGVGECTPEQVAEGCVAASELKPVLVDGIGGLITAVGALISWNGYNRKARNYAPK